MMETLPTAPGTYQSWLYIPSPVAEHARAICSQAWLRLDEDGRWWWHHWDKVLPVDPGDIEVRHVRPCDWPNYGTTPTPKARLVSQPQSALQSPPEPAVRPVARSRYVSPPAPLERPATWRHDALVERLADKQFATTT